MVGANEGFEVISRNLIDQPKIRKGLKIVHETEAGTATLKNFIKCIAAGMIDSDGKMRVLPNSSSR